MQSAFFVGVKGFIILTTYILIPKYCVILKADVPDTMRSRSFEEYTLVLFHDPVIKCDPIICQTLFQHLRG